METQKLTTIVKFGASKFEFQLPASWSVNKAKCLLVSQIPALNFDEFQLSSEEKLLRGTYKLREVAQMTSYKGILQLSIIKTKSEIKLSEYYKNSMGNFISVSKYANQPILSIEYQKYSNLVNKNESQDNNANANVNVNDLNEEIQLEDAGNPGNAIHPLLRALRLVGLYLIMVLIYDHGKAHQIAIICFVILFYYALEFFVKHKQRKIKNNAANARNQQQRPNQRPQPNPEPENHEDLQQPDIENNRVRGLLTLYYYKIIQIIFCFLLTFFPNLSIDMHLQINKEKIDKARQEVNQLIPDSYAVGVGAAGDGENGGR